MFFLLFVANKLSRCLFTLQDCSQCKTFYSIISVTTLQSNNQKSNRLKVGFGVGRQCLVAILA